MKPLIFSLMFMATASISLPAMAAPRTTAAFCETNSNFDFPENVFYGPKYQRGIVPAEVAAVGATNWRCMSGKVYVCSRDASGASCWKMDPSRTPSKEVLETCEENPGQDFVAMAVIGNSASTWRCNGSNPEIIKTVPLDERGFMTETWAPLYDAGGTINRHIEPGADPR